MLWLEHHWHHNVSLGYSELTHLSRQNGHNFADDTFRCIFVNENIYILIDISLKLVPEGPIDNKSVLVYVIMSVVLLVTT